MVLSCCFCSYRSNSRLNLIKHSFASHSIEPAFHIVCGVKGCVHSFKFGSTFSSFKTHASRKHPNWQESVNDETAAVTVTPSPVTPSPVAPSLELSQADLTTTPDPVELTEDPTVSGHCCSGSLTNHEPSSSPPTQRAAALFLLTFQERYKVSQTAINFAVGSINTIVSGVCESVRESIQSSVDSGCSSMDIAAHFDDREDPFASLQTEYRQSKFYREHFGLVVSC